MIDLTSLSLKFLHKKNKTTLDRILNETTLKVSRHLLPKIDKLVSVKTTIYPKHRQLNKLLQQNLSLKTPPFKGHKIWSPKNVHIIFLCVTSIEGTPLGSIQGKGTLFLVLPKPRFNRSSGDMLALKLSDHKKH